MSSTIRGVTLVDRSCDVGPGDNGCFVGVRADGQCGWYGPIATTMAWYIDRHLAHRLAGRPVWDHIGALDSMRKAMTDSASNRWVRSWAIGAIDCALWDLHGQLIGVPVAQLLSSSARTRRVPAYASWLGYDLIVGQAVETIAWITDGGWAFTKWGLRSVDGRRPADLAHVAVKVAQAAGGSAAFDALGTWDVAQTLAFAGAIDRTALIWLEDPLPADQTNDYSLVAAAAMPLALGEHVLVDDQPDALFSIRRLAALTIDIVGCGGLTRALRLVEQAAQHGIPVIPHGRSLVPAAHLAAAFPVAVPCIEYQVQWEPRRQALYTEPWRPELGHMSIGKAPGLGLVPRTIDVS